MYPRFNSLETVAAKRQPAVGSQIFSDIASLVNNLTHEPSVPFSTERQAVSFGPPGLKVHMRRLCDLDPRPIVRLD